MHLFNELILHTAIWSRSVHVRRFCRVWPRLPEEAKLERSRTTSQSSCVLDFDETHENGSWLGFTYSCCILILLLRAAEDWCGLTRLYDTLKAQRTPGNALVYGSVISLIVSNGRFLKRTAWFGINNKETRNFLERKAQFQKHLSVNYQKHYCPYSHISHVCMFRPFVTKLQITKLHIPQLHHGSWKLCGNYN